MANSTERNIEESEIWEMQTRIESANATDRRRQKIYEEIEQGGNFSAQFME